MIDVLARVEETVRNNLLNARILGLIQIEDNHRNEGFHDEYHEVIFMVAWENQRECGTHRVCVNNNDESMCVWGTYMSTREEAIESMLTRAGIETLKNTKPKLAY